MDEELVESKVDVIAENLVYLRSVEDVDRDFERLQAVKHSLQEAVEASLDIANHIIASEGLSRAEEYSKMFERLGEGGFLESDLASRLEEMARFRNLVVHRYGDIEVDKLQHILENNLEDLDEFVKQISEDSR